jgi:TadE-like protein
MIGRALCSDTRGAAAAEFALVVPLLLLFLFGIIDGGRYLWEMNQAEKATQAGVRAAVVTDIIPGGFVGYSYVGQSVGGVTLTQGDRIPASALGTLDCSRTACTCTGTCPPTGTINTAAFDRILARMQQMYPQATAANLMVEYSGSGLGYAGDPNGMDIVPIVSVRLKDLSFVTLTTFSFRLPSIRASLTAEDSAGSQYN